ncbi:cell cycle checkpoint protein RAD1 [Drosophila eugracilis]|uniref:cell cycle checkpoint protein RAD1 n=1 Tax=Drosophila eugracilis TaxID=29029 RepID=UPI001BDB1AD6|nr:cell cycle checkpoint protein RAD1 [Drosophila eugracilis]
MVDVTQSPYGDYKFVGRVDHIKTFNQAIKSICFNDYGMLQVSEDGMRITVEQGKSIQATLFMPPGAFKEFHVEEFQCFGLKMNVLSECLNLFGSADCSLRMMYRGHGDPLMIILFPYDDDDVSTECALKTMDCDEPIDYDMNLKDPDLNVIFVRGPNLAKVFNELEKSAEEFEFVTSPQRPHFKITTVGIMQAVFSVEVAKTSPMMMMFNCKKTVVARYKSQQIKITNKAMQSATKVAIKTNSIGLLELHMVMQGEGHDEIFVQFFIIPLLHTD